MKLKLAGKIFLDYCQKERSLDPKTLRAYKSDFDQFVHFVDVDDTVPALEDISKNTLRSYLQHLTSKYKTKTVKRKIASLRALFRYYEYEDDNFVNPFRRIRINIKEGFSLPRHIPQNEVLSLFRFMYKEKDKNKMDMNSASSLLRNIAVFELLFATGMRVNEVSRLKVQDIDLSESVVRVLGKGNRERTIPICCSYVQRALQNYLTTRPSIGVCADWFFLNRRGNRLSEQSIRKIVAKYCNQAGITRKVTPHMFRHTVATQLLQNGMDIRSIQRLLGHSSILTTQIYTHVDDQSQRRDMILHHPRAKMNILE